MDLQGHRRGVGVPHEHGGRRKGRYHCDQKKAHGKVGWGWGGGHSCILEDFPESGRALLGAAVDGQDWGMAVAPGAGGRGASSRESRRRKSRPGKQGPSHTVIIALNPQYWPEGVLSLAPRGAEA